MFYLRGDITSQPTLLDADVRIILSFIDYVIACVIQLAVYHSSILLHH